MYLKSDTGTWNQNWALHNDDVNRKINNVNEILNLMKQLQVCNNVVTKVQDKKKTSRNRVKLSWPTQICPLKRV